MGLEEALIGGVGGIFGAATGYAANERNIAMQRETNQQNEALMRESWGREDNATQRRVKDLTAAGLSPVLAAGSAAGASSPIKMDAPRGEDYMSGAAASGIQAALAASQMSKTDQDNRRTAAEIGGIHANTSNTKTNELATQQNMKIQSVMSALQAKAISAETARTLVDKYTKEMNNKLTEMDVEKASRLGTNPKGFLGETAGTVADPFAKIFDSKVEKKTTGALKLLPRRK